MANMPLFSMRCPSVENSTAIELTAPKADVRLLARNAR
jgi:hypothetical protein